MIFKRLFIILVSSIVLLNSAYSEERVKGYTGTGNSKQAVQQAKEMCKKQKRYTLKSRMQETMNLSTCVDSRRIPNKFQKFEQN